MSSYNSDDDLKPSSPGKLERQDNFRELTNSEKALKLINSAENRKKQMMLRLKLDKLQRIAEASKEQMRTRNHRRNSFRRRKSFEKYNANVPFSRRSNSRSDSHERIIYNEPLEVINVSPRNESNFQRAMRVIQDRVRLNPNVPRLQRMGMEYIPRSSFGTQFVVRDNDAIKRHTQVKRDIAARKIQRMVKNKTKKSNK
jgi:hypothetical protein